MAYVEVKPNQAPAWDFEESPEFEGTLINVRTNVGPNESMLYEFRQPDGKVIAIWGSAGLDNTMSSIEVGSKVKIAFEGMKKNEKTNREFKSFRVFVDKRE